MRTVRSHRHPLNLKTPLAADWKNCLKQTFMSLKREPSMLLHFMGKYYKGRPVASEYFFPPFLRPTQLSVLKRTAKPRYQPCLPQVFRYTADR
jgi:hypothetical protein